MSEVKAIVGRFPMQELALRRFYTTDPEFKAACDDYAAATCALVCWKDDETRVEEYQQIIKELEDEILEYLEKQPLTCGQSIRP
jgi:hypothetical protein